MQVCGGFIYIPVRPGLTLATLAASLVDDLRPLQTKQGHFRVLAPPYPTLGDVAEWATRDYTSTLDYATAEYSFDLTLEQWRDRYFLIDISYTQGIANDLERLKAQPDVAAFWRMWKGMCERTHALGGYLSKFALQYEGQQYREEFAQILERRDMEALWNYLDLFLIVYFGPQEAASLPSRAPADAVTMERGPSGGIFITS